MRRVWGTAFNRSVPAGYQSLIDIEGEIRKRLGCGGDHNEAGVFGDTFQRSLEPPMAEILTLVDAN